MRWYFGSFFVSGFCSILYEIVWLRLAMAQFTVTSALVSIIISVFMVGLGVGSWSAGRLIHGYGGLSIFHPLRLYAVAELLVGCAALLVPRELVWARIWLESMSASTPVSLSGFYVLAGFCLTFTFVPWCACMGATYPFALAAIRERFPHQSIRSFSYLYLANVLGAVAGCVIPLLLVELRGFRGTLKIGFVLNLCLAAAAFVASLFGKQKHREKVEVHCKSASPPKLSWLYYLLMAAGFTSMGVEIVWIRLFTPGLGTVVYAFSTVLAVYLVSTYIGSVAYRRGRLSRFISSTWLLGSIGPSILLPLLICDPRLSIVYPLRVLAIVPFSLVVGFLSPMILDRTSQGDPTIAGKAYAINVLGCVLGPLVSGFLLLPAFGERFTLLALAIPWIAVSLVRTGDLLEIPERFRQLQSLKTIGIGLVSAGLVFGTNDFESQFSPREVRRDSVATVTAAGSTRVEKNLLVNGVGVTGLTPVTKMIAHLPLAFMPRPPKSALVICFGMGTTHRSILSWGVHSTAVELVPSVVSVFPYFFPDSDQVLASPLSRIVVDDGRFYMQRSDQRYDVIVIDPPPPVEAAGSSLLYSKEFYSIAKLHLAPDGILQQWFPMGSDDPLIIASVAKALRESFLYVRVFHSIEGWGYHFLASQRPLPTFSAATLASHLPGSAISDLLEWGPAKDAERQFAGILNQEVSVDTLIAEGNGVTALQDDRPINEYFILRRVESAEYRRRMWQKVLARIPWKSKF